MIGAQRPSWALAPDPSRGGAGRRAVLAAVVAVLVCVLVGERSGSELGRTAACTVAAIAGTAGAAALAVLRRVREDERLGWAAAGFATAGAVAAARIALGGTSSARESALAVAQAAAVPLLCATAAAARRGLRWAAAPCAAVLAAGGLAATTSPDRTALQVAALAVAVLAAVAAVAWLHGSPRHDAGPHAWVAAACALTVAATAARAASTSGSDVVEWLTALALAVPAAGLALSSARPWRRQTRRWRELEGEVRGLRASSPLLPGRSVTPEDDEGLPTEQEVRSLLAAGRVDVALQPVLRLSDGVTVAHEALARFGGRVSTDRWFRGAGYHGLSADLELLTLRSALRCLDRLPADELLSVNLSPIGLFDDRVVAALRECDLSRVIVEITENEAVRDYARARAVLEELRGAGAHIAVDDVGAGFASLRHVLQLRPDVLKLDQSLTRGVDHDGRQRALVVALRRFADEVGVALVAEGVETREQAETLQAIGLQVAQGWGLGVPVLQRADEPTA